MTVLLFIATIVLFLSIDYFVQRSKKKVEAIQPKPARIPSLRFPEGIFFAKNHTWMNLFPSGKVQLGVDDFLLRMFEKPVLTLLKKEGQEVERYEPILRVEENGKEVIVRSPIEGTVVNNNLTIHGKQLSHDVALFSDGWAYTIKPKHPRDVRSFLLADETRNWMKREMGRLRDFLATAIPQPNAAMIVLQDGGEPMPGVLTPLNTQQIKEFEQLFLNEQ